MVSPKVWGSPRFRKLSDDARLLHVYYLTCPHGNSCGCFHIPDGYVCADLVWDRQRYQEARCALEAAELIRSLKPLRAKLETG
jgi:hypothetical protein